VDHLAGMPLGGDFKLAMHSSGSFSRPYLKSSFTLDALSYRQVPLGGMEAEAEIKDGMVTLSADLSDEHANLSLRGRLGKPYAWNAEVHVRSDAIDPLLILGNDGHAGNITIMADGALTAHGRGLDISSLAGKASFKRLSLTIGDFRIDNESDANLSFDNGKCTITSLNFIGPATRIGINGWAELRKEVDLTLKGTANLSLLKLLFHEVEHAGGTADIKLTIKDDWKNPDLAGELRIQSGEIKMQDIPQRFTALNGRVVLSQGRVVVDSLSGGMGGGTLNISGSTQLDGTSLQDFSIKAAVDSVTVRYPEGLTSTLSGNLYYDGDRSEQTLSGDIKINRARYDKRIEWKTMMVDIGRGLYQKKKTDVGWIGDTQINVRFHGMDSILLRNNLASIPLDVDVFLRGTVNHPQLLGRIEARKGVVYFRKNEFTILNLSVDFIDPNRMNPMLDVQAETQVREYKIRLSVTGNAERASIAYMSEPSLNDTDILSLLALGKRGSEIKGKETGVGVGEAASFATGQFQDILERRARSISGLDRFQVDPYVGKNDTSVPRVTVGKELVQNKLYVTYSSNVGATTPEQIFRIEYLLNRHFSLVGERTEMGNNGADIKYRFEFK
jgi:translocation and assembly module TamB